MTFLGGVRWADISSDTQSLSAIPSTPKGSSSYGLGGGSAAATALLLQHEAAEHSYLNPSSCAAEFENSSAGLNLHFRSAANLGGAEADAVVPSPSSAAAGLESGDCDEGVCERFWDGHSGGGAKNGGCGSSTPTTTPGFKGLLGSSCSHSEYGDGRSSSVSASCATAGLASSGSAGRHSDKHGSPAGSSALASTAGGKARSSRGRPTPSGASGGRPSSKGGSGHQRLPTDDPDACGNWRRDAPLPRAPALTPAKRNRRASGGSCRAATLGRDSVAEEEDDKLGPAASVTGEGALVGIFQSHQPPSKKKRSLHTNLLHAQGRDRQKGLAGGSENVQSDAPGSLKGAEKAGVQAPGTSRSHRNSASAVVGSAGATSGGTTGTSRRKSGGGRRSVGGSRGSGGHPAGANLLLQHMGSISAPFLQIPGFVSPMFLPTLASQVPGTPAVGPAALGLSFLPHPNAKAVEAGCEADEEEWARRECARMKDIAIGKATEGYRNFIRAVPKDQRREGDPATPDPKQRCSKAQFQREYQDWRKQLHRYDSCGVRGMSPVESKDANAGEESRRDGEQAQSREADTGRVGLGAAAEAQTAAEGEETDEFSEERNPILEFNRECELAGL
ncbi:hypothetical protein TGME49_309040 [Toxoplasma gondii ME49]|uniref:Histone RNA hairpin-binding protein RNA-binding domain-containing protein n=11 Tax=Toxoplasma gondii TaxID=5811 RepID=A0A125YYI0_TOXGG|nr:hypothetical protein TGME49_309040 [Toxoplasma gondii ME49]EPR60758.1 hypothetical protein TGGT1_309040 [Toxoplasma gondii GT1]ESS34713.1 putative histone hairpin-binding protein [Toxoplasma gondii VEG]KAF4639103.1 hypothetical protein TGRH88_048740 [Toxoplasma gondii]KFG40554.1 putative histone hairpin-binding protein [Toxoplasma gondii p89]KFG44772.1 putative histone hairpin-binding protein [Toxoplasma gondii GAB2-2007-GAL-DOM2]KFG55670.1 hypothetical protein TGFOU_309040 [Toxoplasma gon|eukprot:XP_018635636.1 hypothetical protein TGME49_309040 [Toxoplasma gondii ME49]